MPSRSTGSDALSQALYEMRAAAGLRQIDLAQRVGVSQSLITWLETGRKVPTVAQADKLCEACGVDAATRTRVVEMAEVAREGTRRVVLLSEAAPTQRRNNKIAETARLERTFTPSILPGLLQTPEYCRALFETDAHMSTQAVAESVAARLEGQSILDSDREFGFLLPEGALGWALLDGRGMAAQMDRIADVSARPNVELGIVPWGNPARALPMNSFTIFDERLVMFGTITRTANLTTRPELDAHIALYEAINQFAVHDEEARAILARASERYRQA
jgi:transcriptional regulator with XRE-family HTH domain